MERWREGKRCGGNWNGITTERRSFKKSEFKDDRYFQSLSEERIYLGKQTAVECSLTFIFLSYFTLDASINPVSPFFKYMQSLTTFHTMTALTLDQNIII